jgi:putative ubiquitin-RnfH superfamily antitoxin RatB of RatAB toxin-antitoxin module
VSHKIAVEVVYALPEKQYLQRVTLEEGATVEAIRASGILSFAAISIWRKQGRDLQPSGEAG